jgi:hypothetical protein
MAAAAMSTRLDALAREKELLVMRSSLARLRLRVAAERVRGSRAVVIAQRISSLARLARFLVGKRAR